MELHCSLLKSIVSLPLHEYNFSTVMLYDAMSTLKNFIADIDECSSGHTCDSSASCQNTDGSYICTCDSGYIGDGHTCRGMNLLTSKFILSILSCLPFCLSACLFNFAFIIFSNALVHYKRLSFINELLH